MAKGVLGNDPFVRGAAPREDEGLDETTEPSGVALPKAGRQRPTVAKNPAKKPAKAAASKKPKAAKKVKAPAASSKKAKGKKTKRPAVLDIRADESLRERISRREPPLDGPVSPPEPLAETAVSRSALPLKDRDEKTQNPPLPVSTLDADEDVTPSAPGLALDDERGEGPAEGDQQEEDDPEEAQGQQQQEEVAREQARQTERRPPDDSAGHAASETFEGEPVLEEEEENDDDDELEAPPEFTEGELISEETRPPEHRLAPAPFDPSAAAKSTGALALAKDILFQALDRPGLRTMAETAGGVIEVMRTAAGLKRTESLDDFGKDENLETALAPLTRFFFEKYWRVHVEGADELPQGPCLLVANHSGALPFDGPVLAEAVRRERPELEEPRWLVEDQVFYAPFLGTLLNRLGAIRASPENAARLLEERRPVIVFPEGIQGMGKPYRERYQLKRFGRGGFAKLAMRTNTPIIPVAIVGAEESMPLLGRLPGKFFGFPYLPLTPLGPMPLPARWSIRFGQPLYPETTGAGAEADLAEVHRLTELTRESIDGMLKARLKDRKSIFM